MVLNHFVFMQKYKPLILLAFVFLVFSSCSGMQKKTDRLEPNRSEAEILLKEIISNNNELMTFKGIGSFNLIHNKEKTTARMAFMGRYPSSLRLEVLGPAGQPMYSLSTHHKTLYFFSHFDDFYYTTHKENASLKWLISMPINVSEVMDLLSGRIPIMSYSSISLKKNHQGNGWILTLNKSWFGGSEKIYLDENRTRISSIEMLTSKGGLKYRADINDVIRVRNCNVPKRFVIKDNEGTVFTLRIDAYDLNFEIEEEDGFILKPNKRLF